MPKFPNVTLAILAGGKATRMGGRSKALLEIDGQTFISKIHSSLSPLFGNVIIISNDDSDFKIPNVSKFPDIIGNVGPLGGIHSALVHSNNPHVFIVSCDMPFADPEIASTLLEDFFKAKADIVVPLIGGYKEPLFAIYSKRLIDKIASIVSSRKGRPITDLFEDSNTMFSRFPDNEATKKCFININSTEDYSELTSI